MKTTIEDVAKIANVSKSTVSRVLNNTGSVSEITKNG
ncbi:regulatory LacI family protein [Halanaerobium congolense]|uniref:Regulatory LacI family protein n=1 Tax=Halanaerobium congolense TaxID=54121 RepID=A0A4R7DU29_9FIRM|nr:LacI family DNA-binding transcriptional regulator [Halanaerobium congolense]TDS25709.1 regulatory LacI family protein [Halanaerobium congolense]